ncbi:DUF1775 domain-containing protein [Phreatobacter aquaticus]|uniref:DUF1775 domain-containing protein n=1 Tax=Phreatobacter aquaticus TaxID=2570229 RepID=A0A4D7QGS9_9HYPH|nr:DUF1775 domain-containing protein [Phreatobacter aquaticus]QCK86458.1 DUF1775 domain-containing protein [Phreatobacter aquaticus]
MTITGKTAFSLALAGLGLAATAASAHVTLERREAPAGSYYKAVLGVPHGCGREPTTSVRVTLPEGFISARPQPKTGWTLAITNGAYAKVYSSHGREIRQGAREITWSGGNLPNEHYEEFVLVGQIDASVPAGPLYFPVVQTCANGENRWVEVPAPGATAHLASPAPSLTVLAAAPSAPPAVRVGNLRIEQPWSRATPGGARVAGGYVRITNTGTEPDRLVSGATSVSERVEIHEMATTNGVMTMRPLANGIVIAPGQTVELKPGGLHIMLMGLTRPLAQGQSFKATLVFEKAGSVELDFAINAIGAGAPAGAAAGGHHHH